MRNGRHIVFAAALLAVALVSACGGPPVAAPTTTAMSDTPATTAAPPTTSALPVTSTSTSLSAPASTTAPPGEGSAPVDDWVRRMTLESKAAQVLLVAFDGASAADLVTDVFAQAAPGGVLLLKRNVTGEEQLRSLTAALQQAAAFAGAPGLFVAADEEGGPVMRVKDGIPEVPAARQLAGASGSDGARELARETAIALLDQGVNMVLAPVADVVANPDSFLYERSYGGDPNTVARFVEAVTAGYHDGGAITVVKHFPGHGSAPDDSHTLAPVSAATRAEFETVHLPPFRAAAAAGADGVMLGHFVAPAYDRLHPASQSPAVIRGLLRDDLGFAGLTVSDDLEMAAAAGRTGEVGTGDIAQLGDTAVAALEAGCDLLITTGTLDRQVGIRDAIVEAVRTGTLSEDRLDEAVGHILAVKQRYSLLPSGAERGD